VSFVPSLSGSTCKQGLYGHKKKNIPIRDQQGKRGAPEGYTAPGKLCAGVDYPASERAIGGSHGPCRPTLNSSCCIVSYFSQHWRNLHVTEGLMCIRRGGAAMRISVWSQVLTNVLTRYRYFQTIREESGYSISIS
jgi:hypothetical protein